MHSGLLPHVILKLGRVIYGECSDLVYFPSHCRALNYEASIWSDCTQILKLPNMHNDGLIFLDKTCHYLMQCVHTSSV
jgi:hypothetical protein